MTISKEKWMHYILIYVMLQFIGGRIFTYVGSTSYGIAFSVGLAIIMLHPKRYNNKKIVNWIVLISASLGITVVASFGNLSIRTYLSILSRFIVVWATIMWNSKKFSQRFVYLSATLCTISLLSFAILQLFSPLASSLCRFLICVRDGNNNPISYGLFVFVFNIMDTTRNSGIFGEPGEMQIMVNLALYFVLYNSEEIEGKEKIKLIAIFLITMLTNRSTTGLINTAVLMCAYMVGKYKKNNKTVEKILYVGLIGMAVYLLFFAGKDSFINTAILDKMTVNGKINLNNSTGAARILSFTLLSRVIVLSPQSLILGVGYNGLSRFMTQETAYACAGLISGLIMYGIITNTIIYGKIIFEIFIKKIEWSEAIFLIFMIVNNGLSQPDIMAVSPVIIGVFFMVNRRRTYAFDLINA